MDEIKRQKARAATAKWRAENREKHRADVKAWRLANPEKKRAIDRRSSDRLKAKRRAERVERVPLTPEEETERRRVWHRKYYLANVDRIREQSNSRSRAWRAANPGRSAILQKAWREQNHDKVLAHKRARKTCKRVTLSRDLLKLQRGRCAYCRIKLGDEFHVDHVMPLKRGGPDKRSNLQLTCEPCNLTKSAKHPVDFARSRGMLL